MTHHPLSRPALAALTLAIVVGLTHCKSATAASSTTMSRAEFVDQYCALLTPCCTSLKITGTGCNADNPAVANMLPAGDPPASAAEACLAAVRKDQSMDTFCGREVVLSQHAECNPGALGGTPGTTPVGGACNDAVTGAECAPSADGQTGCVFGKGGTQICQVQVLAEAGQPCAGDSLDDGSIARGASLDGAVTTMGAYCDRSKDLLCDAASGVCVARAALGAHCFGVGSCVQNAYCTATGVCAAQKPEGAACTETYECVAPDGCDYPNGNVCPPLAKAKGSAVGALCGAP